MITILCALAGSIFGALHATMLWHAVRSRRAAGSLVVRLGIVAALLLVAARTRHLVAAVSGWALGFAAAAVALRRGRR